MVHKRSPISLNWRQDQYAGENSFSIYPKQTLEDMLMEMYIYIFEIYHLQLNPEWIYKQPCQKFFAGLCVGV